MDLPRVLRSLPNQRLPQSGTGAEGRKNISRSSTNKGSRWLFPISRTCARVCRWNGWRFAGEFQPALHFVSDVQTNTYRSRRWRGVGGERKVTDIGGNTQDRWERRGGQWLSLDTGEERRSLQIITLGTLRCSFGWP